MTRLALFDCDGTLVDSGASIHHALERASAEHGLACPPRAEAKKVIGLSLEEALRALHPDADNAALCDSYKRAFVDLRGAGRIEEPLYDGIADLLDTLEAEGWLLGVATGKSRRGLDHVVALHGWQGRFVTLQTADTNRSKPHPDMALAAMAEAGSAPGTTFFVGDTGWDMGCAKNAGCLGIGAGWGYHDGEELRAAGAGHVVETPAEVAGIARTIAQ